MSETYMTLCDSCAEKMDKEKHLENRYYLTAVPGSRRTTKCTMCMQLVACTTYSLEHEAIRAMRRALARKAQEGAVQKKDHRARYRGDWRESET